MTKIDQTDRKILYELDRNSRLPYSKLGDVVGISQEAARYRVGRLVEEEVINKFCTIVDAAKLGFAYFKIFLKLHNVHEENIQEIIGYLAAKPSVCWLARVDGNYDIGFAVKVANIHDMLHLSNLVDDLAGVYDCFIKKRVFCVNIAGDYLNRDYLIDKKRTAPPKGFYSVYSKPVEVDQLNLDILRLLSTNSRNSAVDIASNLPVSSDAVLQRIKRLEQQKIITRYNLVLNHDKLQQIHYKVFIYLDRVNPAKQLDFMNYCKTKPNVVFVLKTLGEWDCELDVEVSTVAELRAVMMDFTSRYGEVIHEYQPQIITKIHKYQLYS